MNRFITARYNTPINPMAEPCFLFLHRILIKIYLSLRFYLVFKFCPLDKSTQSFSNVIFQNLPRLLKSINKHIFILVAKMNVVTRLGLNVHSLR